MIFGKLVVPQLTNTKLSIMQIIATTERLVLRNMLPDDAPDFYEMNSDLLVQKYTGDVIPKDEAEARQFIIDYPDYEAYGYGRVAMVLKETNEVIGFNGLKYLPEMDETDLGYRLKRQHWGKGYATEGAIPMVDYAFNTLKLDSIILIAMEENTGSTNIAKKLGFTFESMFDYEGDEVMLFRLTREEYLGRK